MKSYFKQTVTLILTLAGISGFAQKFPLSGTNGKLDQETITAALEEARENDVDVSTQNAILYKGLSLFQEEEYDQAILFLEEALRMDPSMTAGWEALGWAYVRTERPEHGFELWEYFRSLMPESWMPYNLLAQAAIMKQDWKKADDMFRKMLNIKPDLFDQRYWFAQNLLRIGKMEEAEETLRKLIKEEPGRLDIQIDLANLITHSFEYDEATQIWRHVNEELPGNPKFMMNQADLEVRIGELRVADQLCQDVLGIQDAATLFPDEVKRAMTLRVEIAEYEDSSTKSVDRLRDLIADTDDPVQRSQQLLRLANRCAVRKKEDPSLYTYDEILDIIRQALNDDPYNLEGMVMYSETCVLAKKYRSAESSAKHILKKFNRNNIRAKDVMFECALYDRRFDDASQIVFDRYDNSDPTDPMRYRANARILMAKGEFQEALRTIDQMEAHAQRGTVLTLMYHGLTESDWIAMTSARRLREHVNALRDAGFTFISPSDIPQYAGLREGESSVASPNKLPWLARTLDYLVYQVSGYRRFRPSASEDFRDKKPMKYVAVTFDDGLRSSYMLGTDIAEHAGVAFGMFAITKPQEDYQPSVAGWEEVRKYVTTGAWEIGSHLYSAHYPGAVDREGKDIRRSLVNKLWLAAKNRIESMNEWDARMRKEFRLSREIMKSEMAELDCKIPMVAYPYGDLGQESTCNLFDLRNPMKSLISEASRSYQIGFIQNISGYTSVGDNLLLCRRYEPNWNDEGADVVKAIYEYHPVFMARRTRVELALYMNKPHMAEEMIELMRRDGYPEELCREIESEVLAHFRNIPKRNERPIVARAKAANEEAGDDQAMPPPAFDPFAADLDADTAVADQKAIEVAQSSGTTKAPDKEVKVEDTDKIQIGDDSPWLKLSNPFVSGQIENTKANEQFEINGYGLRAGVNSNPRTTLSAEWFTSDINQSFHPRWNAITNDMTKVLTKDYEATKTEARLRWSHRMSSGATVSASIGNATMDLNYTAENTTDIEDDPGSGEFYQDDKDTTFIGDLGIVWNPRNDMRVHLFYSKDLVMSAVKFITSDSIGGEMDLRPFDIIHVNTKGQYWSYSDDNALFSMQGSALVDVLPDMGVLCGVEAYTVSSSTACDYYWTPYWDQRVTALARYKRLHKGYDFELDFNVGLQREDGRPLRRKQDDGLSAATDWGYIWGFGSRYYQDLTDIFSVGVEVNVTALREYVDHQLILGLTAEF